MKIKKLRLGGKRATRIRLECRFLTNGSAADVELCEMCGVRPAGGLGLCHPCRKKVAQEAIDELEAEGILRKNGQFRKDSDGRLSPVYEITELAIALKDPRQREEYEKSRGKKH